MRTCSTKLCGCLQAGSLISMVSFFFFWGGGGVVVVKSATPGFDQTEPHTRRRLESSPEGPVRTRTAILDVGSRHVPPDPDPQPWFW